MCDSVKLKTEAYLCYLETTLAFNGGLNRFCANMESNVH